MVNDMLHGEWIVDGTALGMRLGPPSGARMAASAARIWEIRIAPILIEYAASSPQIFLKSVWRREPRFQTSRVWSRSGNKKTRGCGNGKYVKGQDHVFPHPGGVLAQRRARAVAERRSQADRRGAERRDRRGRGRVGRLRDRRRYASLLHPPARGVRARLAGGGRFRPTRAGRCQDGV